MPVGNTSCNFRVCFEIDFNMLLNVSYVLPFLSAVGVTSARLIVASVLRPYSIRALCTFAPRAGEVCLIDIV